MSERSKYDRFQFDGSQLDEIVLSGVTFHIERMSHHGWWLGVTDEDTGEHLSLWWQATGELVIETDRFDGAELVQRPPVHYACPTHWIDRRGGEHRCEVDKEHARHRCECGATKKTAAPNEHADRVTESKES